MGFARAAARIARKGSRSGGRAPYLTPRSASAVSGKWERHPEWHTGRGEGNWNQVFDWEAPVEGQPILHTIERRPNLIHPGGRNDGRPSRWQATLGGDFRDGGRGGTGRAQRPAAGFTRGQLAVICSDKSKEQFFANLPAPELAGPHPGPLVGVGAIGATVGGCSPVGDRPRHREERQCSLQGPPWC